LRDDGFNGSVAYQRAVAEFSPLQAAGTDGELVAALALAARGRTPVSVTERVSWVMQNLALPWAEVEVEGVPDCGAVSLLDWAKRDPGEFFKLYDSRLLPSRSQLDDVERMEDDGRELAGLMGALLRAQRADVSRETGESG
jgi:hypothetical protein